MKETPAGLLPHPVVGSEGAGKLVVVLIAPYRDIRGGGRRSYCVRHPPRKRGIYAAERVVLLV